MIKRQKLQEIEDSRQEIIKEMGMVVYFEIKALVEKMEYDDIFNGTIDSIFSSN